MKLIILSVFMVSFILNATASEYLSNKKIPLTKKEWRAIELTNKWIKKGQGPIMGNDGQVIYLLGESLPTIVCQPLKITTIDLEKGEQVLQYNIGDKQRWSVSPVESGPDHNRQAHLIIKPKDVGLDTTLFVATNKRTYYLRLVSRKNVFISRVAFEYPENIDQQWTKYYNDQEKNRINNTISDTKEHVDDLDFNYAIKGRAKWKPIRVYNNGKKTIIQFPQKSKQTTMPTLYVVMPDKKEKIVNYRVKDTKYIVDEVFEKAILVDGVGRKKRQIIIQRHL